MELILTPLILLACALACVHIAKQKNRDTTVWALLGIFFGVFAIVLVAILPPAKDSRKT